MQSTKKIAVLGAGIAGVTTAIGLKKLGFDVTMIYKNRPFTAYEGFSEKTKEGLVMFGCNHAAEKLTMQSSRNSNWANIKSSANYEYVVCRDDLDRALLEDAKEYNIILIEGKVIGDMSFDETITIHYKTDVATSLNCDFLVDARGRFTPYKAQYQHGPKNFSILQELELSHLTQSQTSIDSIENGWVWQANVGNKKGYIQFTCDEKTANTIHTFEDLKPYLKNQEIDLWSLKDSKIKGSLVKRDSYLKIHETIVNEKMILVGDSASSIDPLSGNGAFQTLSMASIAPYVVNTILNKQQNSLVAQNFYKKRVEFIFEKFSHVGKEFYSMETRFDTPFWTQRQSWPKEEKQLNDEVTIEEFAIVTREFIEPKEVVVTKDNPLGIYFIGNIEIVELVKYCLHNSKEKSINFLEEFSKNLDKEVSRLLKMWLVKYKIL